MSTVLPYGNFLLAGNINLLDPGNGERVISECDDTRAGEPLEYQEFCARTHIGLNRMQHFELLKTYWERKHGRIGLSSIAVGRKDLSVLSLLRQSNFTESSNLLLT